MDKLQWRQTKCYYYVTISKWENNWPAMQKGLPILKLLKRTTKILHIPSSTLLRVIHPFLYFLKDYFSIRRSSSQRLKGTHCTQWDCKISSFMCIIYMIMGEINQKTFLLCTLSYTLNILKHSSETHKVSYSFSDASYFLYSYS